MSSPRAFIQILVIGSQIVGKALLEAGRQAAKNARHRPDTLSEAGVSNAVSGSVTDKLTREHRMTLDEAHLVLNTKKDQPIEQIIKNYEHLFSVNSPPAEPPARPSKAPTYSHYLLSKVVRARERIDAEINNDTSSQPPTPPPPSEKDNQNLSRQLFQLAHRRQTSPSSSSTSDVIRLMVGIALGGLGVVSLRLPFTLWSSSTHVLDLPSVFLTICLVAFFALIAYLTNPNESSFRAFLTEHVFRQHLSRLSEAQNTFETDDLDDDSPSRQSTSDDELHRTRKLPHHGLNASSTSDTSVPVVFHFANKASVSLRTPSYDFRSFFVITFAVVPPVEMAMIPLIPPSSHTHHHPLSTSPKPISWNNPCTRGSCFIGAFGRWWLAFEMNMQPRQVKLAAQNDALISSRLRPSDDNTIPLDSSLSQSLSRQEDLSGKTAAKLQQLGTTIPRRSSGSSRANNNLREKSSIQSLHKRDTVHQTNLQPRPTTPPPLPKSASLPLHAKRVPPSPELHKQPRNAPPSPILPTCSIPPSTVSQVPQQGSQLASDPSPIITDLLEQLEAARGATSDLQAQLAQAHTTAVATTASLEAEVAQARATKKSEEAARNALKTRTKSLDDARRHADSVKRESEKKLKAVETQRDNASDLIQRLDASVHSMKREMEEEVVRVEEKRVSDGEKRVALTLEIASKREELKNVEEQVQILAARARVLESTIAEETVRYEKLKEVKDKHMKEREKEKEKEKEDGASASPSLSSAWPPRLSSENSPGTIGALPSAFTGLPTHRPSPQLIQQTSHIQPNLNITISPTSHFRPFEPHSVVPSVPQDDPLSPTSASLIPSSLMQSIDILSPRGHTMSESEVITSPIDSPTSSGGGNIGTIYEEPFNFADNKEEVLHLPPVPGRIRFDDSSFASPSVAGNTALKLLQRPKSPSPSPSAPLAHSNTANSRRKWFGINSKEKGLNPDAKVFTLPSGGSSILASSISPQNNAIPNHNNVTGTIGSGVVLDDGFGRIGFGHAHTNSSTMRSLTSDIGTVGSATTAASPSPHFFHHPRSSLSAPSLQEGLFIHGNNTGRLSFRDSSSPPTRSAAPGPVVPPLPVPPFPFDGGFFSTLQNAFAPSPEEREALLRVLGGAGTSSANTSREKLTVVPSISGSGSSIVSNSGPLSSSGSGSSGSTSISSSGAASGSPSSSHRTTGSITNPSPRWNGNIAHMPITTRNHTHIHALSHSGHTHSASSRSGSQTQRSIFDPWAGEGKSDY
ncbi:hypothetical protein Clacol_000753 [Clathrus columnatus]|uniref:Mitochondrial import inner membrane translocase subunit TIM16 n=1 Tax=Clathrus columnatus TaxID=1419009 RepID=A0AAV5A0L3_9AGAM|nr:hypothetical protein Clacol_000753 [Clathrus columnatus]